MMTVALSYLTFRVDTGILEKLGSPPKKTIIFELELMALLVAMRAWGRLLSDRPVVCYVDNDSVSGNVRAFPASHLVALLMCAEDAFHVSPWYSRVPSASNPADEPSRTDGEAPHLGTRALKQTIDLDVRKILSSCAEAATAGTATTLLSHRLKGGKSDW